MPELPDVEVYRRYLNRTALHRTIEKVDVEDKGVLDVSPRSLQYRMKHRTLEKTRRHGKYLFVETDRDDINLAMHFGMTGYLDYYENDQDDPEHSRVLFRFKDGSTLAYVSRRKLGRVDVPENLDQFIADHDLGPDVLEELTSFEEFQEQVTGRRGAIKSLLMNQKALAGIGNVYADEILFQEGVHPETSVDKFDEKRLRSLYHTMRSVLEKVIERKADPDELPRSYLLPHREEGADCPRCAGKIEKLEIGGRATYVCSKHQEKL